MSLIRIIIGGIVGSLVSAGAALIIDTITGRIGGRLNKIDELAGN